MVQISKKGYKTQAAFRYAIRKFLRVSEQNAKTEGITHLQYQLLLAIKGIGERDWATITELAESLQIFHHSAAGLCKRAEQIDLVKMTRLKTDRRNVCVQLTKRGERLLAVVAMKNRCELEQLQKDIMQMFAENLLNG